MSQEQPLGLFHLGFHAPSPLYGANKNTLKDTVVASANTCKMTENGLSQDGDRGPLLSGDCEFVMVTNATACGAVRVCDDIRRDRNKNHVGVVHSIGCAMLVHMSALKRTLLNHQDQQANT